MSISLTLARTSILPSLVNSTVAPGGASSLLVTSQTPMSLLAVSPPAVASTTIPKNTAPAPRIRVQLMVGSFVEVLRLSVIGIRQMASYGYARAQQGIA